MTLCLTHSPNLGRSRFFFFFFFCHGSLDACACGPRANDESVCVFFGKLFSHVQSPNCPTVQLSSGCGLGDSTDFRSLAGLVIFGTPCSAGFLRGNPESHGFREQVPSKIRGPHYWRGTGHMKARCPRGGLSAQFLLGRSTDLFLELPIP